VLSLAAVLLSALSAQAQTANLTHNNSSAFIDLNGSGTTAGMTSWTVDGINHLSQQWFWFRAGGMTSEQTINSIGGLAFSQPDSRTLYSSYFNGSYGVSIAYLLTGFSPGSGISDISEAITITNATDSPLEFHFFQYSNFQLGGNSSDTTVQLGRNLRGLFNEASVVRTNPLFTFALSETVVSPGANHGEAANFSFTLGRLSDAAPTTLNDNAGPIGGGVSGPTWAFQWDFIIAPGSSVGISKDKYLQVIPIPEPSGLALVALCGLAGWALKRRRV
jgi:hypothetical protein